MYDNYVANTDMSSISFLTLFIFLKDKVISSKNVCIFVYPSQSEFRYSSFNKTNFLQRRGRYSILKHHENYTGCPKSHDHLINACSSVIDQA